VAELAVLAEQREARRRRSLVTPEGVDLSLSIADAGQRAAALMLDLLIMVGTLVLLTIVAIVSIVGSGGQGWQAVAILWLLGFFLLRNGYFILMEMGPRAATFGKRACGLRVVARDGGRLTADAVIARNLMREIEIFLPLTMLAVRSGEGLASAAAGWLGLGWTCIFLFFPLFNKDRLRVGDLLAGTWVVNVPRRDLALDLLDEAPAPGGYSFTDEQLAAYGVYELQTLEQVLRLRNPDAMATVAATISGKIGAEYWGSDEDFLSAYYEALRQRLERGLLFGRRRKNKFDIGA
jgi:uncharacterized RDD family membrane protein YckC